MSSAHLAFRDLTYLKLVHSTWSRLIPKNFRALELAYSAAKVGGTLPTVLSSADEVIVQAFLNRKIGFMDIPNYLEEVMTRHDVTFQPMLDDILAADQWARSAAQQLIQTKR